MAHYYRYWLIFLGFSCLNPAHTQSDDPINGFLWEISGNGLQKPSYLFGTIHLQDKRVFTFPDQVLDKLAACDAFAMEIHPDSIGRNVINSLFSSGSGADIRDFLTEKENHILDSLWSVRFNTDLNEVPNRDPAALYFSLNDTPKEHPAEKLPFFMDIYLCRQASAQGKELLGLEKMQDYRQYAIDYFKSLLITPSLIQKADTSDWSNKIEALIAVYKGGNLEDLMSLVGPELAYMPEMDTRNEQMAKRLAMFMREKSVFCAAGAAHMYGESGLVRRLERMGYTLRRVRSTHLLDPDDLPISPNARATWAHNRAEGSGFDTPVLLEEFNSRANATRPEIKKMYGQFDALDSRFWTYMQVQPVAGSGPEKVRDEIMQFTESNEIEFTGITIDGNPGYHFTEEHIDSLTVDIWVTLVPDKCIHVWITSGTTPTGEETEARFLKSIKINRQFGYEPIPADGQAIPFRDVQGAFSVILPGAPEITTNTIQQSFENEEKPMVNRTFTCTTKAGDILYRVDYFSYPPNIYITDKDTLLRSFFEATRNKIDDSKEMTPIFTQKEGHSALRTDFSHKGFDFHMLRIIRGNRAYALMTTTDPALNFDPEPFFNSFHFLPLEHMDPPAPLLIPDPGVRIRLPRPVYEESTLKSTGDYPVIGESFLYSMDSLSGITYSIRLQQYSPYAEGEDTPERIIASLAKEDPEEQEKHLIYSREVCFHGFPGWESLEYFPGSDNRHYSMVFSADDHLVEIGLVLPDSLQESRIKPFLDNIELEGNLHSAEMVSDKTRQLFNDLTSPDTLARRLSREALVYHDLDATYLPDIYNILSSDLSWDTILTPRLKSSMIIEFRFNQDEKTLPFLRELYANSSTDDQEEILTALTKMGSRGSRDLLLSLLEHFQADSFEVDRYDDLLQPFYDSLELAVEYFPQLARLQHNRALRYSFYQLTSTLLQADSIDSGVVMAYKDPLLEDAWRMADRYHYLEEAGQRDLFAEYWHLNIINSVLSEMEQDEDIKNYLSAQLTLKEPGLLVNIVDGSLLHGLVVPESVFDTIYQTPYEWHRLLQSLTYEDNLAAIPLRLISQQGAVRAIAGYYFGSPQDELPVYRLEILEKIPFSAKGTDALVYVFQYAFEDGGATYMGVCPQPTNETEWSLDEKFYYFPTPLTPENREEIRQKLLERLQEGD